MSSPYTYIVNFLTLECAGLNIFIDVFSRELLQLLLNSLSVFGAIFLCHYRGVAMLRQFEYRLLWM